jgi:hypothetical protein
VSDNELIKEQKLLEELEFTQKNLTVQVSADEFDDINMLKTESEEMY